jgi:hypothetical protein
MKDPDAATVLTYDAERYRQGINWHASRERDYRRAISRPWEPTPNYLRDPPWPPIPANLYPQGADPNDFWTTSDGRWGTRAQIRDQGLPSSQ